MYEKFIFITHNVININSDLKWMYIRTIVLHSHFLETGSVIALFLSIMQINMAAFPMCVYIVRYEC